MPRRLGQHFLRAAAVERLLAVVDPRPHEAFLEIGPGAGALTLPLAARAREVTAVELDADVAAFERLVRTAFTRRRRTLENNLQDSYPNLKEHLRLLNIEGRRRAETLSVVEFAQLTQSLRDHR